MDLTRQYVAALRLLMARQASTAPDEVLGSGHEEEQHPPPRSEQKEQNRGSPGAEKLQNIAEEVQRDEVEQNELGNAGDAASRTSASTAGSTTSKSRTSSFLGFVFMILNYKI